MNVMGGTFQVGDRLQAIVGPYNDQTGGVYSRVGQYGVSSIEVDQAAGPMGLYAVANVFRGADLVSVHPIHMLETVVVEDAASEEVADAF